MSLTKEKVRLRGTDSAKIIRVIETKALAGSGTPEDPHYIKVQYWDMDGRLLAENAAFIQEAARQADD